MIYYTADTHFGDGRIIRLCNRPFKTLSEMNSEMVRRWNAVVDANDDVYIIGDFAYGYRGDLKLLTDSLKGKLHLIPGNHDGNWLRNRHYRNLCDVRPLISTINDAGRLVVLCHYPLCAFDGSLTGGYHVYGHVHNNYNEPNFGLLGQLKNSYNAGVDVNDFTPVTLDQMMEASI